VGLAARSGGGLDAWVELPAKALSVQPVAGIAS